MFGNFRGGLHCRPPCWRTCSRASYSVASCTSGNGSKFGSHVYASVRDTNLPARVRPSSPELFLLGPSPCLQPRLPRLVLQ